MLGPAPSPGRDAGPLSGSPVPRDAEPAAAQPKVVPGLGSRATPNLYIGHAKLENVLLRPLVPEQPSGTAQIEFSTCAALSPLLVWRSRRAKTVRRVNSDPP
jgi:hypothetical protein